MKDITLSALRHRGVEFLSPLGILAVSGILLSIEQRDTSGLSAAVVTTNDFDGDGLTNKQELILGTSIGDPDTDHDGFGDAEELARKSSPLYPQAQPSNPRLDLGMTVRSEGGMLHAVVAVYLPDGDRSLANVTFGFAVNERFVHAADGYMQNGASISFVPGKEPLSQIALFDIPFSPRWVHTFGQITLYATAGAVGSGVNTAADTAHLMSIGGMVVYVMPKPIVPTSGPTDNNSNGQVQEPGSRGTMYVPLPDNGGAMPATWSQGQICAQSSEPVALNGAIVTQEVVRAACESGWEGFCAPDCESSVGTTFTTVDPLILIGG